MTPAIIITCRFVVIIDKCFSLIIVETMKRICFLLVTCDFYYTIFFTYLGK